MPFVSFGICGEPDEQQILRCAQDDNSKKRSHPVGRLHVGVATAHVFVEAGLDEGEGFLDFGLVGCGLGAERVGDGSPLAGFAEGDEAFGG